MKLHPFLKHLNGGFGLTEAMLAAGLMGGIALMSAKLSQEMNKSAKGTEVKFEYQSLHADIRAWLTNEDSAYATFSGTNLTTCNGNSNASAPAVCQISSIKFPLGSPTTIKWQAGSYQANGTSGKNNGYTTANLIEIDSMWLSNFVKNGGTAAGTPGTGDVTLNIRYENLGYKTRATGVQYSLKQVPIRVNVDGSNVITGAVAASGSGGDKWLDLADMTGIYYGGGGVRVGTSGVVFDGASMIMGSGNTTNSANTGAFGTSNYVNGLSSFAIGHGSIANTSTGSSGTGGPMSSIAIGRGNTASGSESTAIGYGNVATDRFAMALGTASYALGYASYTLGSWTMASGQNSLATGYFSESHGFASNSFGSYTKANASGSMTLGDFSTSTFMVNNEDNSLMARFAKGYSFFTEISASPAQGLFVRPGGNLMVGDSNTAVNGVTTGSNSIAVGKSNTVSSQSSGAIGTSNTVSGALALGLGYQNKVGLVGTPQGWSSMAIGAQNSVSGAKSVAIGWNNTIAGDNSFAVGAASRADAHYALALGVRASAIDPGATVMSGYPAASFNIDSNSRPQTATTPPVANPGCGTAVSPCPVGGPDSFTARFRGGYRLYTSDPGASIPTTGVFMGPSASSWGSISDKTKKEDFEEIDGEELLQKIAGLEIVKWKYIGSTHQHLGPMAQDFYQAFKLGDGNDRIITTQDIEGVTIAGVQALEKRTKELQKENEDLKKRIERLESLILSNQK